MKKAAAIHDISCAGRCSLTVALPIISCCRIETIILPTALLSQHTGFSNYSYLDLTDEMQTIVDNWKPLGLVFDAVYTGFLGSFRQVEAVCHIMDEISSPETVKIIDPAMADNGVLYKTFSPDFPSEMVKLCKKADIILPNLTEAVLLTGDRYTHGPHNKKYVQKLMENLAGLTNACVVMTGIHLDEKTVATAVFDGNEIQYTLRHLINGYYPGTGDVFGSAFTAALLNGQNINEAAKTASVFTAECICVTKENGQNPLFGVMFEKCLPTLMKTLGLI